MGLCFGHRLKNTKTQANPRAKLLFKLKGFLNLKKGKNDDFINVS